MAGALALEIAADLGLAAQFEAAARVASGSGLVVQLVVSRGVGVVQQAQRVARELHVEVRVLRITDRAIHLLFTARCTPASMATGEPPRGAHPALFGAVLERVRSLVHAC
jgi:hypothetical protein